MSESVSNYWLWALPCDLFHFKGFDHHLQVQTLVQPVHSQLPGVCPWHLLNKKTRLETMYHGLLAEQTGKSTTFGEVLIPLYLCVTMELSTVVYT